MAQWVFPSSSWNETVNVIDTVILEYTSTYANVNFTLFCEKVEGTGGWIWWPLPGPLPGSGTYNLHLNSFDFPKWINVFPTDCHLLLIDTEDKSQNLNGAGININTFENQVATTWAMTTTATSIPYATDSVSETTASTMAAPSHSSSRIASVTLHTSSSPTNISDTATANSSPSHSTRVAIGVGVSLGIALLAVLAILAMMLYRKRRKTPVVPTTKPTKSDSYNDTKYERIELSEYSVNPQRSELPVSPSHPQEKGITTGRYSDQDDRRQPPQELWTSYPYPYHGDHRPAPPSAQRYELGA